MGDGGHEIRGRESDKRHEKRERGNKSIQLQPVNKKGDTVKSEKERLKEQQYIIYQ